MAWIVGTPPPIATLSCPHVLLCNCFSYINSEVPSIKTPPKKITMKFLVFLLLLLFSMMFTVSNRSKLRALSLARQFDSPPPPPPPMSNIYESLRHVPLICATHHTFEHRPHNKNMCPHRVPSGEGFSLIVIDGCGVSSMCIYYWGLIYFSVPS